MRNYIIKSAGVPFLNVYKGHIFPGGPDQKPRFSIALPIHELPAGLKEHIPDLIRSAQANDKMHVNAHSMVPPVIVDTHGLDQQLRTELETAKWHNIPLDPLLVGVPMLINVSVVKLEFETGRPVLSPRNVLTFHTIGLKWTDIRNRLNDIRDAALKIVDNDDDE